LGRIAIVPFEASYNGSDRTTAKIRISLLMPG
jgi:hypothetical protein